MYCRSGARLASSGVSTITTMSSLVTASSDGPIETRPQPITSRSSPSLTSLIYLKVDLCFLDQKRQAHITEADHAHDSGTVFNLFESVSGDRLCTRDYLLYSL